MNPGELNYRILIQKKTGAVIIDDQGITREIWEDVTPLWSKIEILQKQFIHQLNQIKQQITIRIKIRYSSKIQELMRVKYGDKLYDIFSFYDPTGKRAEMYLMCAETVILDKICKVYRLPGTNDATYGRPINKPELIAIYPCTFVRNNADYKQNSPNAISSVGNILYGEPVMDIKTGDLIEIDGINYIASIPYKPSNHHTEVEISIKGDV